MFDISMSKKLTRFATILGAGALFLLPASEANASCVEEPYLASVCMTAAEFCPTHYLEMEGQLLPIAEYNALFALLGCRWGGDCTTTLRLPDMRSRSPIARGKGPGLTLIDLGQFRGAESRTLVMSQMPIHNHGAEFSPTPGGGVTISAFDGKGASPTPSAANSFLQTISISPLTANPDARLYGTGTGTEIELSGVQSTGSGGGTVTIGNAGGSQPFSIGGPVLALTHCMAVEGLFPPRP